MKRWIYTSGIGLMACLSLPAFAQNNPSPVVGDTGTVTFTYRGSPVTYTTVRAADGKVWFQQNMGSSRRSLSLTDTGAYGHLFQWGRWDDGHQLRNSAIAAASTLSANNPSGLGMGSAFFYTGNNPGDWWDSGSPNDSWTGDVANVYNGIDPCVAVGPGWHLPNITEWGTLLTLEGITNTVTAFSSNLMLPAAGMRESINGNLLNVGTYGNYWSNSTSMAYAKDVTILNNAVNNSDDALRSYGFSVRCMLSCPPAFPPFEILGADTVCDGSMQLFHVQEVSGATGYIWSVPAGWSILGTADGDSVMIKAGSTTGIITVKTKNACSDTSTAVALTVTVDHPMPVITASDNVLNAGSFVSYQWMLNGSILTGQQNPSLTVTQNGAYRVIVTDAFGCSDTSAAYNYNGTGIGDLPDFKQMNIYPVPAKDLLYIDFNNPDTQVSYISVKDVLGRVLNRIEGKSLKGIQQYVLPLNHISEGTYFLHIQTRAGEVTRKIQVTR